MDVDPDESLFDEGISLIKAGKIEESIDIFSELVERDKRNHKAWNAYGVALSQTTHKESAIHCFENALAVDPGNKIYLRNLSRVKTPPARKIPPKMRDLVKNKRGRGNFVTAAIFILVLFIIGSLALLLVSGMVPGFSLFKEGPDTFAEELGANIPVTPALIQNSSTAPPEPEEQIIPAIITPLPPAKAEVLFHFIDVSQGDAALIQSEGKNLLIDAGPSSSGQRLVDYLKRQNITSLDLVVASHSYEDHIGGMIDILDAFDVKTYVDNGVEDSSDVYQKVIASVISDQAVRKIVTAGMNIPFTTNTKIDVVGPYRLTGHPDTDSLVLRVSVHNVTVLFPGDSSEVKGKTTILKIPDHGSDNAVSPIMDTRPEAVIISLASGNPYGYPRSATLGAIEKQGSQIFRTDLNGTIVISTDGENWTAKTSR